MAVSVNAPDTLQVDAYEGETTQGQALLGQLSALDSAGADLTYLLISQPAHGVVTVKENGDFTYYPDSGFNGADRFQFVALQVIRAAPNSARARSTLPCESAPLLDLEWGYTTMNTSLSGQFKKAEDPDGDPIAWKLEASPAHGTVQVDAGELIDMLPMKTISGTTVFAYRLKMDVADVRRAICWSLSGRRQIEFRNRFTFMPHPAAPIRAFSHPRTI